MENEKPKAIYVEDETSQRKTLPLVLAKLADTTAYEDYPKGLEGIRNASQLHLLITDITMPGGRGYDLIAEARKRFPEVPAIVVSGLPNDLDEARTAMNGAERVFYRDKPYNIQEFRGLVAQLLGTNQPQ